MRALKYATVFLAACAVLAGGAVLVGCAAPTYGGRPQLTVPSPMSTAYSEINMQLRLVTMADAPAEAGGSGRDEFDRRVARIGSDLAKTAFELYPDLRDRIDGFEFIIADKSEPGTVSTSQGRIVILRPVSSLAPNNAALAFIIGREMGHVLANHHDENTATAIAVSGVAYVLFPLAGIAKAISALFLPGTAAVISPGSMVANASATATSFVGSRVLMRSYRPKQREEADMIAMKLLVRLGYDAKAQAAGFAAVDFDKAPVTDWTTDLRASLERMTPPPPGNRIDRKATAGLPASE